MPAEEEVGRLLVRLTGDSAHFRETLHHAQEKVSEFVETVTRTVEAVGISEFLRETFHAFTGAETGAIRLKAALEGSGENVDTLLEHYEKFAEQTAKSTLLNEEQIESLLTSAATFGLYGDAAQNAVTDANNLAVATNTDASSMLRFTAALQQGTVPFDELLQRYRRFIPQLRNVKTEEEGLAVVERLLRQGQSENAALVGSTQGSLVQFGKAWEQLKIQVGAFVADAVKPVIKWLTEAVNLIRGLPPEWKQMAVWVGIAAAAFLALGPAISILKIVLAPIGSLIGTFFSVLGTVLGAFISPIGLAVFAIAGLGAAIFYWTDAGGEVLAWFGRQWDVLVEHIRPAIKGVTDAIAAGDLALAFEIVWVQIQLSFAKATQALRVLMAAWVTDVQSSLEDVRHGFTAAWEELTGLIARKAVATIPAFDQFKSDLDRLLSDPWKAIGVGWDKMIARFSGDMETYRRLTEETLSPTAAEAREYAAGLSGAIRDITKAAQEENDKQHKNRINQLKQDEENAIQSIIDRLKALEAKRDELAGVAAEKRAAKEAKDAEKQTQRQLPPITQDLKLIPKFDAAAFRSAEAITRIQEFQTMLTAKIGTVGVGGVPGTGGEEGLALMREQRDLLKDLVDKPEAEVLPAGVA